MSESLDRITMDPAVMNGQPCIRGMRITVSRTLEAMAKYPDWQELLREHPELEEQDLRQALAFAAASLDDKPVVKEIVRSGLRFPIENEDYEVPSELGEELLQLDQEVIDAKNRQAPEVSSQTGRTGEQVS